MILVGTTTKLHPNIFFETSEDNFYKMNRILMVFWVHIVLKIKKVYRSII